MRITCGDRTRKSSGKGRRRMAAKAKRDPVAAKIRAFSETDAAAAAEILRASPEASQWTEWGFRELLGWRGLLALVSEDDTRVTGFLIVREVSGGGASM